MSPVNRTTTPMRIGMVVASAEEARPGLRLAAAGHTVYWYGPKDALPELSAQAGVAVSSLQEFQSVMPRPVVWFAGLIGNEELMRELIWLPASTLAIDGRSDPGIPIWMAAEATFSDLEDELPRYVTVNLVPRCTHPQTLHTVDCGYQVAVAGWYRHVSQVGPLVESLEHDA